MTNDEKAKAYEMALEAARKELGVDRKEWEVVQRVLRNIFPEFRESEDERIRKWLVNYFDSINETVWIHMDITCEQILEWLEKQKEQKPEKWEDWKDKINIPYCSSDEQKPVEGKYYSTDSGTTAGVEGQKSNIEICPRTKSKSFTEVYMKGWNDAMASVKHVECKVTINGEPISTENQSVDIPLAEWSEEDERRIDAICELLENTSAIHPNYSHRKLIIWLKSLRPQPKPKWSEEDKRKLSRLYSLVGCMVDTNPRLIGDKEAIELEDFLKSLRPSWKPSDQDELMKLKYAGTSTKLD